MPQRTSKKRKMLLIIADIRRVQEGSILSYSFQWTSDCGGHCPIRVRPSEPVTHEKYPSLCMKEVSLWALTPPPLSALYNPFLDSMEIYVQSGFQLCEQKREELRLKTIWPPMDFAEGRKKMGVEIYLESSLFWRIKKNPTDLKYMR